MNQQSEALKLLRLAENDLIAYRILRDSEEADPSVVLFHAQQCVEKCLKAVLINLGKTLTKTHDLTTLAFLIAESRVKLPTVESDFDYLTPFAVTYRYDDLDYTTMDYTSTTEVVVSIFNWANELVRNESQELL